MEVVRDREKKIGEHERYVFELEDELSQFKEIVENFYKK